MEHNPFHREAAKAAVRASLANYLALIWLECPDVCALTVDMTIDRHGDFSVVASFVNIDDVQLIGETL